MNWKVRIKSPAFWIGMIGVVMSPILAYMGMSFTDLTTWRSIGDVFMAFIGNPYLIGSVVVAVMSAIGVAVDPTTAGFKDTLRVMAYTKPSNDRQVFNDENWK